MLVLLRGHGVVAGRLREKVIERVEPREVRQLEMSNRDRAARAAARVSVGVDAGPQAGLRRCDGRREERLVDRHRAVERVDAREAGLPLERQAVDLVAERRREAVDDVALGVERVEMRLHLRELRGARRVAGVRRVDGSASVGRLAGRRLEAAAVGRVERPRGAGVARALAREEGGGRERRKNERAAEKPGHISAVGRSPQRLRGKRRRAR